MTDLRTGSAFAGFRIEGLLGRGGMGTVYLAREPELERRVALKVIRAELIDDDAFRRRFSAESRAAASIEHPRVVDIYRAGEHRGRLYMAMRYVPGIDLQAMVMREGTLSPHRAVSLIADVGAALDAIHAAGLIHRDVKPSNVIVAGSGGEEVAYLTDFGLAKAVASTTGITRTGEVIGSLDYLAPEQIENRSVDARADVYALGCVLFQLLTGNVPFPARESPGKLWAHVHRRPPSVRTRGDADPGHLDAVVQRALAKDPGRRFPSAGDLGRAALAAVEGEPVREPERLVATGLAASEAETLPGVTERLGAATAPTEARPRRPRSWRRRVVAGIAGLLAIGLTVLAAIELPDRFDDAQGTGAGNPGVEVPDVAGERLDLARQQLQRTGLRSRTEGGGLFGIVVPENWEVCSSLPTAGDEVRPRGTVRLMVDRPGACE